MAKLQQDDQIPEIFLGGIIASGIYGELKLNAHIERLYSVIASEIGPKPSPNLITKFEGNKADVAVYKSERPVGIIELKVLREGKNSASVIADRDKMLNFLNYYGVDCYIGALITDLSSDVRCEARIKMLETALGQRFDATGDSQEAFNAAWHWRFVGTKISAKAVPPN
jgi:hypothetical protein